MLKHCLKNSFSMLALSINVISYTGTIVCQNRYCAPCFLQMFDCFPKEFLIGIVYFIEVCTFGIP